MIGELPSDSSGSGRGILGVSVLSFDPFELEFGASLLFAFIVYFVD
jgi:hypothetical protein